MRIAQFVHRYPPALGGSEAYTARLSQFLASRGDSVQVWTTQATEISELWYRGRQTQRDPITETPEPGVAITRYAPRYFPARRYILKGLSLVPLRSWQCLTMPCNPVCPQMWRDANTKNTPLDAVHAVAFPYSFPIACALRLAKRNRVPFFLTPFLHLGDPTNANDRTRAQYTAPHLRWLLRQADGVFVQTQREYDTALSLGVAASRLVLQGLGVEPRECTGGNRDAARTSWRVLPQTVVVGHLANNSAEKGTIDLLRAAELAWNRGVEFRVVLAGPEMPNFRNFWEKYRYQDRVLRLGTLSEAAKRDFLAGIDSFALPSRSDSFGLVLLEAWANGKPNVVYAAGGPGELVQHGRDGLHAKCGDVNDLANQLCLLVENQSLRESLGAAGFARLASEFDWIDKLALFRDRIECLTRDWALRGSGQVTAGVSCP